MGFTKFKIFALKRPPLRVWKGKLHTGGKYLQTTYPTKNYYQEYTNIKNSQNLKVKIIQLKMGQGHEETFHQTGYEDGKMSTWQDVQHHYQLG